MLGGAALLMLSAFAPWALFRLIPFLEAGAVGHLEGLSQRTRHSVTAPMRSLAQVAMRAGGSMAASAAATTGGLVGSSLLGSPGSGPGGRPGAGPRPTGIGPRGGGGGGGDVGPGGAGLSGEAGEPPDLGPSSAESTGVGTTEPPGHGIPMHPVHPEATATAHRMMAELEDAGLLEPGSRLGPGPRPPRPGGSGGGAGPGATEMSVATGATGSSPLLVPLPRQTGTVNADRLGRDHLGVRLIAAPQPPAHSWSPVVPPGGAPTGAGTGPMPND